MANKEKVAEAYRAMKILGIDSKRVHPVLKEMFKLYNGKWELIEEDNYRALADTIFEQDEEQQAKEASSNCSSGFGESEFINKKPHELLQEDQVSSALNRAAIIIEDDGPSQQLTSAHKVLESRNVAGSSIPTSSNKKGKNPIFSEIADKKRKRCRVTREIGLEDLRDRGVMKSIDIASSPSGEVKISLNCNPMLGQLSFDLPQLYSLIGSLEKKYVRSYQMGSPQFSVVELLRELCESYAKRGFGGECNMDLDVPNPSFNKKKSVREISDITKGTEKVEISLVDEYGNEHLPDFVYIHTNTIYQNAFMHFSLARIVDDECCSGCEGNCLTSSVPCECARETGGEFAYTSDGLLKEEFLKAVISMNQEPHKHYNFVCKDCPLERAKNMSNPEPCKGHLVRKFIKECWRKCGCNMQCGNRVVQRGISRKLQVFMTKGGKGWGLRPVEELPRGAFVCEYVGEILTNMELYERNKENSGTERHTYPVLLDADWCSEGILKDEDALCLDATKYGNVARFINHRCHDANLLEVPVEVESADHHYYHLAFFTKRKVAAFEELTWDYGLDFDDLSHPIKAFQCCCSSSLCRDKKNRGKASQLPASRRVTGGGEQMSSPLVDLDYDYC